MDRISTQYGKTLLEMREVLYPVVHNDRRLDVTGLGDPGGRLRFHQRLRTSSRITVRRRAVPDLEYERMQLGCALLQVSCELPLREM